MGTLGTFLKAEGPLLHYEMALHQSLRKDYARDEAARRHELHASLLDGDHYCLRRTVLAAAGQLRSFHGLHVLLRFEDGHWRHKKWQHRLLQAKLTAPLLIEQRRTLSVRTLCTTDSVIYIARVPYIWECKGMRDDLFRKVVKENKPPAQFIRRMHLYFAAQKIPRGILHIDAKGSNEFKAFLVHEDPALSTMMLQRVQAAEKAYGRYLKHKQLPPRCAYETCDVCRR